ncbi:MAG: protein kinase [Gemmataceae bacterium]|nr:protein kinase [Gemmataceae bacterium]
MAVRIEAHAEPIPGYRLIERLGGGGFGEVWKCEAPGGLHKAIKFVFGDLKKPDGDDGSRAEQELKALSRVKSVRHPYILSIERFDIIDGQLVIVMELADRTLWDRFRECRAQGLPGIPRIELLEYMRESAEALDLMNEEYQLQHLDIKPQNLFLIGQHIKVADFGLAKDMGEKAAATVTGGVTPVYAAPETFDGWLSRYSDQYSLAIVYQELLTGQRPFSGTSLRQLVLQHLQEKPELGSLPVADRSAVSRALAKNPEDRFPTCQDFIRTLKEAGAPKVPAPPARQLPQSPPPSVRNAFPPSNDDDLQKTQNARGKLSAIVGLTNDRGVLLDRPQGLPPRARYTDQAAVTTPPQEFGDTHHSSALARPATSPELDLESPNGVQPSVVIGLGTFGVDTVLAFRKLLSRDLGPAEYVPWIRLLAVDMDAEALQAAHHGGDNGFLQPFEAQIARLHRPAHYLKSRDGKFPMDSWLNSKWLYRMPRQQNSAGLRALGRLAFVDNYRMLSKRFQGEIEACLNPPQADESTQRVAPRCRLPRVYVVANLAGNTGSGMFLDVAYVVRQVLRKQGYAQPDVVGLLFVPPTEGGGQSSAGFANAYAALTELRYFSATKKFSANYTSGEGQKELRFSEVGPPFARCFLTPLPFRRTASEDSTQAIETASQFLYRDLATMVGTGADEKRKAALGTDASTPPIPTSYGMFRLEWPRRRLLQQAARVLCKRLVERWMNKDARALTDELRQWSHRQWEDMGLRAEALISSFQDRVELKRGEIPEKTYLQVIQPLQEALTRTDRKIEMQWGPAVKVLNDLEGLLGIPEEFRPQGPQQPGPGQLESLLAVIAERVAQESEQRLAEVIVKLIEKPAYRLAGAEEALKQMGTTLEQALVALEPLSNEVNDRCVATFQRILAIIEKPLPPETKSTLWSFSRKSAPKAMNVCKELIELLQTYAKTRFQNLVLHNISRLYVALRGHLSDQIREVGFCRQRLTELAGLIADKAAAAPVVAPSRYAYTSVQSLLPEGCAKIEDAGKQLEESVTAADLLTFDQQIQDFVRRDYRALVEVCLGPSHIVKKLMPQLFRHAESFLEPRVSGGSVSELLLRLKGKSETELRDEIYQAFKKACPELGNPETKDFLVALVPNDDAGHTLESAVKSIFPQALVVFSERCDEIVFYREKLQFTEADLELLGPKYEEMYRKMSVEPGALHSREDIASWEALATVSECSAT